MNTKNYEHSKNRFLKSKYDKAIDPNLLFLNKLLFQLYLWPCLFLDLCFFLWPHTQEFK